MIVTPRLALPLLAAGQAQKHVTHNDALTRLDALIHLVVDSRSQAAPPVVPTELSAYIVPAGATGAFAGHGDEVALFEDGGWTFLTPRTGWQAWVTDEAEHHLWTGSEWRRAAPLSSLGAERWGVNATADATNRLAVSSEASLFNHAGGDHRLKLNKAGLGHTASLVFQDGWSGRAELGLAGDDDFRIKVSADGEGWNDALAIDRASGAVALPGSPWACGQNLLINGDMQVNQRGFAGGALAAGAYGFDRWKAGAGGADLTRAGLSLTLAAGSVEQVVEPELWGLSSFAGLPMTLSVEEPSGAVAVAIGSLSGAIPAGPGRLGVTLTAADSGPLTISLSAAGGGLSFRRAKLELGPLATGWPMRRKLVEEQLCRRYYWRPAGTVLVEGYQEAGGTLRQTLALPVAMRVTPMVSCSVSQEINIQGSERGLVAQSPELAHGFATAQALGRVRAAFAAMAFDAEL